MLALAAFLRRRTLLSRWRSSAARGRCTRPPASGSRLLAGVAIVILDRRWRMALLPLAALGLAVAAWVLATGLLRGRLETMDADWLQALASKD